MRALVAPFVLVLVVIVTLTPVLMMSWYRKGVSVTTAVVSAALCQPTRLCESAASCAPLALAGQEAERQWNNDSEGADDGVKAPAALLAALIAAALLPLADEEVAVLAQGLFPACQVMESSVAYATPVEAGSSASRAITAAGEAAFTACQDC